MPKPPHKPPKPDIFEEPIPREWEQAILPHPKPEEVPPPVKQEPPAKPERVILTPQPPSNVSYPQVTAGISRNMMADPVEPRNSPAPDTQGGGDLNGSANTVLMLGQAGTDAGQLQLPRQNIKAGGGNYCGIV